MPMRGAAATAIGLGLRGAGFGLGGTRTTASGAPFASGEGSAAPTVSAGTGGGASGPLASGGLGGDSAALPGISPVVAAATSRAGMTTPSSAGAGSFGRSGAGFFPRLSDLPCGTLKSRTVGSGTGSPSAPKPLGSAPFAAAPALPDFSNCSCNWRACFSKSRARRSRSFPPLVCGAALPSKCMDHHCRHHSPNLKLVR